MDFNLGDDELIKGSMLLINRFLFNQIKRLKAINQITKYCEFLVEGGMLAVSDKELRTIPIRSKVGHAENATSVMAILF